MKDIEDRGKNLKSKTAKEIRRSIEDRRIREAVSDSQSYAGALRHLGLTASGANYKWIKSNIARMDLDTSHMTGEAWLRGKTHSFPRPHARSLEEILVVDSDYQNTNRLRQRLIKAGLLQEICSECGITKWNGKQLSLHLDHINGVNNDNRIENLRILCPNCHSQTDTFAGRGKARKNPALPKVCCDCNKEISLGAIRCRECSATANGKKKIAKKNSCIGDIQAVKCRHCSKPLGYKDNNEVSCRQCAGLFSVTTKIEWPPLSELRKMVAQDSHCSVGRSLGVSDNAVRKHIRSHIELQNRREIYGHTPS